MSETNLFASLLADIHEDATPQDILDRVVETVRHVVECDGAACALWQTQGELKVAAFTGVAARPAATLQLELGDGPCMTAVRTNSYVRIDNVSSDDRWPDWAKGVVALGVKSSLSVALTSSDPKSVGSLFLYSHRSTAFDDEDVATARILAAHAAIAVRQVRHDAALERAIDSRTITGQATGIIMNRYAVTAEQAFAALTRCSQAANVKLRDIAAIVVHEGDLPDASGPPK